MSEDQKQEYYSIQVACANCGKGNAYDDEEYEIFIPKGIRVDDFLEKTPCSRCGCYDLSKIMNFVFPRIKDKENKKQDISEEKTNSLNADMPSIFKKKPKYKVKKIIK